MDIRHTAIVIRTTDMGESDRLLTLFTPDAGRMTVRAKGCRSAKSKLRYATQPMCFGNYLLAPSKAGYIVTGCDEVENFAGIAGDLARFYVASVVLDAAYHLSQPDNGDAALFVAVLTALKDITYGLNPLHSGVCFLVDALRLSGHALRLVCACGNEGNWLDLATCSVCCEAHKAPMGMPVGTDTLAYLQALPQPPEDADTMHQAYVLLARCLWHTMGIKLQSVQELCKQWAVLV